MPPHLIFTLPHGHFRQTFSLFLCCCIFCCLCWFGFRYRHPQGQCFGLSNCKSHRAILWSNPWVLDGATPAPLLLIFLVDCSLWVLVPLTCLWYLFQTVSLDYSPSHFAFQTCYHILSHCIGWISKHQLLCTSWLLPGWDGWTGWGVGGTGVGQTDVRTRRNGSATMGARTGAPPLAPEGWRAMWSGSWHQLCRCCKDVEYLRQRSKIIQIECTQIRTSNVVQDSIKSTYDTILLWLNTTINCTYNVNVPKNKSQKNVDTNIEDSVSYKAE